MHHFDLDVNLKIFKTRIYYIYGKLKKKKNITLYVSKKNDPNSLEKMTLAPHPQYCTSLVVLFIC